MSFNPRYNATPPTLSEGQNTTGSVDSTGALRVAVAGGASGIADGDPDAGSSVKVAGVYNTTPPANASGDRIPLQTDARGNLRALTVLNVLTSADGVSNTNTLGVPFHTSSSSASVYMGVMPFVFNGTGWDRLVKPNAVSRLVSAANTTNATLVKNGPGNVSCIHGYNASASVRYLKLYNKASAPTVGTDTPFLTLALAPTSVFRHEFNMLYFATGIGFGLTTGSADNDTAAVTAADILGLNVVYA